MTHQTPLVRVRPRVPLVKVVVRTFTGTRVGKVEMNNDISTGVPLGVLFAYLTEQDEFLGCRVGDGSEYSRANFHVELVFPPIQCVSGRD